MADAQEMAILAANGGKAESVAPSYERSYPLQSFIKANSIPQGQQLITAPDAAKGKGVAMAFPSVVARSNPRDNVMAFQSTVVNEHGEIPGVGLKTATDSDVQYYYDKHLSAQEANFRSWFLQQIDVSTPERQAYWKSKFPQVFNEKKDLVKKQIKLTQRALDINLFGPETMDDYYFMYCVQQGIIQLPKGPLHDPAAAKKVSFERGFFNIHRWYSDQSQDITWTSPLGGNSAPFGNDTATAPLPYGAQDIIQARGLLAQP